MTISKSADTTKWIAAANPLEVEISHLLPRDNNLIHMVDNHPKIRNLLPLCHAIQAIMRLISLPLDNLPLLVTAKSHCILRKNLSPPSKNPLQLPSPACWPLWAVATRKPSYRETTLTLIIALLISLLGTLGLVVIRKEMIKKGIKNYMLNELSLW